MHKLRKVPTIGITGGSCSGKTTIALMLQERFIKKTCVILSQDAYYKDRSCIKIEERDKINFDHPSAFDNHLFIEHIRKLKDSLTIRTPIYDFITHTRKNNKILIKPPDVLLIEGLYLFLEERLLNEIDYKIFIDCPADIRLIRRIKRDMVERGRTLDSILNQYFNSVRIMHNIFVEQQKNKADIIINGEKINEATIDILAGAINELLKNKINLFI
ncbi:MAG: uridine kinase [Candidatus Micrarchaeia archaeon]